MIKAIIFDLGGVVVFNNYGYILQDIVYRTGESKKKVSDNIDLILPDFQKGLMSEKEFWNKFAANTGITPPKNYQDLWISEYAKGYKEDPKIINIIRDLKEKKYMVAALSNTIAPHTKYLEKKGIIGLFDKAILSNEVHMRKPDREIYELTLRRISERAEECVYIDDVAEFLESPKSLGMQTIHYIGSKSLVNKFSELEIL